MTGPSATDPGAGEPAGGGAEGTDAGDRGRGQHGGGLPDGGLPDGGRPDGGPPDGGLRGRGRLGGAHGGGGHGDPEPGADWGRYRIETLLGAGGLGRVWKAWDLLLHRHVALKCLVAQDPAAVDRLLREAQAQARIEHENVCKVYDAGEVGGRPYIAMQLVAGGSLHDAAREMNVEQRVEVMRQVA
jgi:hypothetical protein